MVRVQIQCSKFIGPDLQIVKKFSCISCGLGIRPSEIITASSDTIFIQIYMDAPPGVPGVSKNHIYFFTNETVFLLR